MLTPCLQDLIATVPSCSVNTPIATAIEMFQHWQCDRLVIVTPRQHPTGILYLSRLLPSVSGQNSDSMPNLEQPLSALDWGIIQPVATLRANLSLEQLQPYLNKLKNSKDANPDWAVVDSAGKFLGLVDYQILLQSLLGNIQTGVPQSKPKTNRGRVTQQDFVPRSTQYPIANPPPLYSPLQLLERLPLPLMLQTADGQVLKQNSAWRRQFSSLPDLARLQQEAGSLLEFSQPQTNSTPTNDNTLLLPAPTDKRKKEKAKTKAKAAKQQTVTATKTAASVNAQLSPKLDQHQPHLSSTEALLATPSGANLCQMGATPDTCICAYPMPNGSQQVWQFVKIPLGKVLSNLDLMRTEPETAANSEIDYLSVHPFRLANINHNQEDAKANAIERNSNLWLVLAQDVTEQQQVAKELAAKNADLIQLNRLKDEFLACISHELKTPLTAIMGLSSLLKDQLLGELNERQARYVRLIHQSGRHLMTVVNDILDLTRIETGQMKLMPSGLKISILCDRAYEQAQQLYQMQHTSEADNQAMAIDKPNFVLEIEPGLESIVADELRLRQMLAHLLSNALKFTQTGGSIGLRVNRWEGWIAFCVWDTGIGIPEQKQHLIFQKFQQLENPLTREFQGTGLGLVLTQRLAHLHGGDISFISQEGKGSEFTLLLPPSPPPQGIDEESEEETLMHQVPQPMPPSRLVLIVEPTARFIEDLSSKLIALGYRVAIARSGTEALIKARTLQPLAILLNPLLPLLSGWDVLTLLKSYPQTRQIPTIITATLSDKKQAYRNGADDFLCLPLQSEALRQSLERLTTRLLLPKETNVYTTKLTILCLNSSDSVTGEQTNSASPADRPNIELSQILHRYHYRVLEADDLAQAEMLARIWQPHVVVLQREIADPLGYLEQLSQHSALAILPLVTLDRAIAEAANQFKSLSVFPCLEPLGSPSELSALLQAIQVAAGMSWKPNILMVDISTLPDVSGAAASEASSRMRTDWQKALIQYLQTAGFRGAIARSWDEVLRQIQHRSTDLLLIDLGDSTISPAVAKVFLTLDQLTSKPPTLVLDRRLKAHPQSQFNGEQPNQPSGQPQDVLASSTLKLVQQVATQILPKSVSVEELLDQIRQTLAQSGLSAALTSSSNSHSRT